MKKANCPSCGAAVNFRGAASIVAVCEFCRSTLVRDGAQIEDIGKMAELLEDVSPLALGSTGRYQGVDFRIVGRIQYRYGSGIWNEWYCLFDDQRAGWLSDASGNYVLTFLAPPAEVPEFAALKAGGSLAIFGANFEVANVETAQVIAGAGELPFKVGAGWDAPVADLRDPQGRFATIDYSETPPMLYLGEQLSFESLHFSALRDPQSSAAPANAKAQAFNCPGCGAPLSKRLDTTEAVGCGSCGAVIDVAKPGFAIISRAQSVAAQHRLSVPLGSRGRIEGLEFEVVGYMRRGMQSDGQTYEWGEYLLHNTAQGYRWISEYQGHFSLIKDLAERPAGGLKPFDLSGRTFRHFQRYQAKVSYVLGEFYWRVAVGESAAIDDYVAPPILISKETTRSDASWSIGEYIEPEALWAAFGLKTPLPRRVGIAPNQPSPYTGKTGGFWRACAVFVLLALAIHLVVRFAADTRVLQRQAFAVAPGRSTEAIASPAFTVGGARALPLAIETSASVSNSWVALDMSLVEENTGHSYWLAREIGYYHGVDGGESWSEGSREDRARVAEVPPGQYHLELETESDARAAPVSGWVEIRRDPPDWTNLLLALIALALMPVFAHWRAASFEARRWAESDYAPSSGDDDDSGDDD